MKKPVMRIYGVVVEERDVRPSASSSKAKGTATAKATVKKKRAKSVETKKRRAVASKSSKAPKRVGTKKKQRRSIAPPRGVRALLPAYSGPEAEKPKSAKKSAKRRKGGEQQGFNF